MILSGYGYREKFLTKNNRNKHAFFCDKVLKEEALIRTEALFFTRDISQDTGEFSSSRRLDRESLFKMKTMYVLMLSPDGYIRGLYDGWYRHNENHTALINDKGLTLPYDGLGISFQAFYGEPQEHGADIF